jgi:hypothetical protein
MKERSARQRFLGADSDAVFANACVAVVGNCGGGSHVVQQLAHVGIGRFVLIDPDVTESANLNRMVGSKPRDAAHKRLKIQVLRRLIKSVNPGAKVIVFSKRWQECALQLRSCDLVFGCVDGYITRSELEAYCRRFLLPYIDIGMDVSAYEDSFAITGQIICSLPGRPCMWCMGFLTRELLAQEAARYGAAGPRPQVIWPNGVLASISVGVGIRLLTPWNKEPVCPYLVYDGNRQTVTSSSRLAHLKSTGCSHYPLEQVGDPLWSTPAYKAEV